MATSAFPLKPHAFRQAIASAFAAGLLLPGLFGVLFSYGLYFPTALHSWGMSWLEHGVVIIAGVGAAIGGVVAGFAWAAAKRVWRPAIVSLLFAAGLSLGWYPGKIAASRVHAAGIESFAERSSALVRAIRAYQRDHDGVPENLEALVPAYLAEIPETDVPAFPRYLYSNQRGFCSPNNEWHLAASGSGQACLLLCPDQDYGSIAFVTRVYSGWAEIDLFLEMPKGVKVRLPICR